MTSSLEIAHSGSSKHTVSIGDQFDWWDGTRWEVVKFTGGSMYSPSGFGGTPTLLCKQLAGDTKFYKQYTAHDGTVEWCGDSVAGALARRT